MPIYKISTGISLPRIALIALIVTLQFAISDTIFLKTGFRILDADITEVNSHHIVFLQNNVSNRISIRDVVRIVLTASPDSIDRLTLRSGESIIGSVSSITYDSVSIVSKHDSAISVFPASEVLNVSGRTKALSYRSPEDKFVFLASRTIYFEAGKPTKPLPESAYRFTLSTSASLPAGNFRFSLPDKMEGNSSFGYGIGFELDYQLTPENSMIYAFQYTENRIDSPDSLGSDFSLWKNLALMIGIKKYFQWNVLSGYPSYLEGLFGGLFSTPPENDRYLFDKTLSIVFGVGGGVYISDNVSVGIRYLNSYPQFNSSFKGRDFVPYGVEQNFSVVLFAVGYSMGSGN
ncbi:MAG: hypothetical protein HYV29_15470 [Ignavibacteriales bacterium]|nr:hypothetical protein [Ignavibacteriales bacterium]